MVRILFLCALYVHTKLEGTLAGYKQGTKLPANTHMIVEWLNRMYNLVS